MIKSISSPTNPLIKNIVHLTDKSRARKDSGTFVVEGQREILLALKGGYLPKTIIFNPTIVSFNPVSYTHLDVYKRQVQGMIFPLVVQK